jgi:hypothetical protein
MNQNPKIAMICICLLGLATAVFAGEKAPVGPIKKLALKQSRDSFGKVMAKSSRKKPLLIEDAATAAKYFSKDELKALAKEMDFKTQKLVVFAWSGSGGDKLTHAVMESYPEQIRFQCKRGRTKDLRSHWYVYALRKNVTFSCK